MPDIGAFEAKTRFSEILARATRGEAFTITHRGRPVAQLVPLQAAPDQERALAAYARMRARAQALAGREGFSLEDWKQLRDEGRP